MDKKVIIANSFSINMLSRFPARLLIEEVSVEDLRSAVSNGNFMSCIGHEGTSQLLSEILNIHIPVNRVSVQISEDVELYVFQVLKRLNEGEILSREKLLEIPYKLFRVKLID